jgi:hypothetical protein
MRSVLRLPDQVLPGSESVTSMIGHINFDMKITGKRNAGNPHVAIDEAGDGNVDQLAGAQLLDPTCAGWRRYPYRNRTPSTAIMD